MSGVNNGFSNFWCNFNKCGSDDDDDDDDDDDVVAERVRRSNDHTGRVWRPHLTT